MLGGSPTHLEQYGEEAGRILANLSPVGRMLCSSLNMNEERWGPRGCCLARKLDGNLMIKQPISVKSDVRIPSAPTCSAISWLVGPPGPGLPACHGWRILKTSGVVVRIG